MFFIVRNHFILQNGSLRGIKTDIVMSFLSWPLLKGMTKWHIVQGTPSSYKTAAPRMMFSIDWECTVCDQHIARFLKPLGM
ncbi:hypothetical protein VSK92_22700 [Bacillus swezeyi]|uniref:hypothetical protein n=1 Tax=Bacillus swezeyi TaxID=1925020 RepID=UPI0039C75215